MTILWFMMMRTLNGSRNLKRDLRQHRIAEYTESKVRNSLYRPFTRSYLFFDQIMNNEVFSFPSIFPTPEIKTENRVICVGGYGRKEFAVLMSQFIPDMNFYVDPQQAFPFYTYEEDGRNRRENITDWALAQFRAHYRDDSIGKWDIFHYVYGLLHHPEYRERYQANLKRDLPHLPYTPDFWGVCQSGGAVGGDSRRL